MTNIKTISAACVAFGLTFGASAALADDLQRVTDAGEMSCALSGAFPPFSFVDQNNAVVGFDVDICTEIAKRLGVEPKVVTTAWDGIIAGLVTGRYDTIIGSMGITDERLEAIDFAGPYYHSGLGIFVADTSDIASVDALQDKTIGVTLGELSEEWARDHEGWDVRTYKGLPELLLELKAGRVDAIVADDIPVLMAIKDNEEPILQIEVPDVPLWNIGIALRQDNPEFKAAIQAALDDMMADGRYAEISMKWIGTDIR